MHERYAPAGLVIVAVHAPEFDQERNPADEFERRNAAAIEAAGRD